jgi:hypothetical protein
MITNLRVDLSDADRLTLGKMIYGKEVLASRKDVTNYVQGYLNAAIARETQTIPPPKFNGRMTYAELSQTYDDPHLEGKNISFIVGWNKAKFGQSFSNR